MGIGVEHGLSEADGLPRASVLKVEWIRIVEWAKLARGAEDPGTTQRAPRKNGRNQRFPLPIKVENPSNCRGFQWRRRELNSEESPDSADIQRSSSAASESHETEIGREGPPCAAELAVRQGDDAGDDADPLWEQAARTSGAGALAFSLDGEL